MSENECVITGVKFKLKLSEQQKNDLNKYFSEYAKAIVFAARKIRQMGYPPRFIGRKIDGKWIFPTEKCGFCKEQKEIRYKETLKQMNVCHDCYNANYSENAFRKKMAPVTRGKRKLQKIESNLNIYNATKKLIGTHYHYVVREAYQILDGLEKRRKKQRNRLYRDQQRFKMFKEMLSDSSKRFALPLKPRQRELRYIHISQKERAPELWGYTMKMIKNKIAILQRNTQRDYRTLKKRTPISFKATRIMIPPPLINYDDNKVTIIGKRSFDFFGSNVKRKKSKEFFRQKIEILKKQKTKYAYIIRKEGRSSTDYFLQYTLENPVSCKTSYDGVIGVDTNIRKTAVLVLLKRSDPQKPSLVRFMKGGIEKIKIRDRKRKYYLRGVHNKNEKLSKMRRYEPRIDYVLHNISKEIVNIAAKNNAAIAIENLEKIKKSKIKQRRLERYYVSLFISQKLANFIAYKASKEGIKVFRVPPEGTSRICSHCESSDTQRPYKKTNAINPSYSLFKCNSCGIELNADYNAAFNIAKKGLNMLPFN